MPGIKGINRTSLWKTWKTVRKDLRYMNNRDIIDFVDYDVDPDKWIGVLLKQLAQGKYEPHPPQRFTLGKSNGFSRVMTQPGIPDLVLYRTIVDLLYSKAIRREHSHVYFKREQLQAAQQQAAQQAAAAQTWLTQYRFTGQRSFYNWLRYAQYRKHLLMASVHPFLVITDVTNFFDSLLHSHVQEAVRGLSVNPRLLGLMSFLLERLSIRQDYESSHGISLPVDQFDCSRTLAHLTLFRHDDEMVNLVGEDNYIRWMDDQNFGVDSRAEGLRVLSTVGQSLARLHLTANAKKSRVLTLREARRHFHLDLNGLLDKADSQAKAAKTKADKQVLASTTYSIWKKAKVYDGVGEFDKILKRLYRLAGFSGARFLRSRALRDVLRNPDSAERVFSYMRCSGTVSEYLDWAELLMSHDEQVYPDVNAELFESFLRLEPNRSQAKRIRHISVKALLGKLSVPGESECRALAPLLMLRFGDRRSLPGLRKCFEDEKASVTSRLLRSAAVVYASYGKTERKRVRAAASRRLFNSLADIVRLVERIEKFTSVPDRYKARLDVRYDSVAQNRYIDMRALLTVRLLHLT